MSPTAFNVTIDGSDTYEAVAGIATTGILQNSTSLHTVLIENGEYFPLTYTDYNVSSDITTSLYQAEITLHAYEKITGDELTGTFKRNGTIVSGVQRLNSTSYNFTFINASYYQKDFNFTPPPLYNDTVNITGVYDTILTVAAHNAYSGMSLSNLTGWAYHNSTGYNESFSTSTGVAQVQAIAGYWYVYAESPGYAVTSANYVNPDVTAPTQLLNYSFYSSNSVLVRIYDEDTGLVVTSNISVTFTGNASEDIYYTATGELLVENLTDGDYTIKLQGGNYTLKSYTVTVADRSHQNLNAYLSQSENNVILTFLDFDSGATLQGVDLSMYRLINSTWTLVQAKQSDISGRVQLQYTPAIKYRFDAVLSGYNTNIFYLDPIIFDSYNVRLSKVTTLQSGIDYLGVSISYYPTTFYVNRSNLLTWIIESPLGVIEDYNLSVTYPGGSGYYSGNSTIGEQFTHPFNITGASLTDRVNISYCYDISIGSARCFSFAYSIIGVYGNNTYMSNIDNTYGLGLFERILIATLAVIIVAGFLTFLAGPIIGAVVGLFIWGFLSYIGFAPLWAILPSLFVGFIVIAWRSSQ